MSVSQENYALSLNPMYSPLSSFSSSILESPGVWNVQMTVVYYCTTSCRGTGHSPEGRPL